MDFRKILFVFFLIVTTINEANAQKHLPVLKANSNKLSIREGPSLYKDVWNVSSSFKPDVFVAQPFRGKERIVFYSDTDSLSFWVKPQRMYDFIVLINEQDSAYTRITTNHNNRPTLTPKLIYTRVQGHAVGPDTINFQLDKRFGIHVQGKVNGSEPLNFLFDTGAGAVVIASGLVNQRVRLNQDGQTLNKGVDGSRTVLTSSGNTLEIDNLRWSKVSLLTIDYAGLGFDGVLGWVAFENKIVELDYEQQRLVIHDQLPPVVKDYSSVDMQLRGGIPFIKCSLTANGQSSEGWFDLDTGSDGWLVAGHQFAASNGLINGLRKMGTAKASGSTGGTVHQTIFSLPRLKVGDYELYQLPLYINDQDPVGGATSENIGSNILKRFNILIDFRQSRVYVKPNNHFYTPVKID